MSANPGALFVKTWADDQHQIESDFHRLKGEWSDIYVAFGGHFGAYGPHLFAAAPDMANALRNLVEILDAAFPGTPWTAQGKSVLAKAEGRSNG